MAIQEQGMYRQGPSGGQFQQRRPNIPNYQGTYPTYLNNPLYNIPMQQQQGFTRNMDQMYPPYSTGQQQNSQQQPYADANPILGALSQLMEQMNRMNSHVDEIQDFIKMNIPTSTINKKGKQVSFSDQLPSQATINLRNQGSSS